MKKSTFLIYLLLCFSFLMTEKLSAQNQSLQQLFDNYYEDRLKLFPMEATIAGDNRYNNLLPNIGSSAFLKQVHDFYTLYLNQLNQYQPENLQSDDRISWYILKDKLDRELESEQFHPELMPFAQVLSLPLIMGQLGSGKGAQPFKTVQDYENWLQRIDGFTVYTDTVIANFRKGIKAGMVLPKALVVKMIPQMESLAQSDTGKNVFYGPIRHFPSTFTNVEKDRLTIAYNQAITSQLIPAYQKLSVFFSREYLAAARITSGLSDLPNGDAMYRHAIYYFTTTRKTPEEIYATGLSEVSRITGEMEKIKIKMGFNGSLTELFNFMKRDQRFMPFKTVKEVLDSNWAVLTKIEPQLKKIFSLVPKTPFEIRETESFRAASASPQYIAGSDDGTRPGIFYIPILDPAKINVTDWGLESTFLHEAIPGHHYQISLQQENTSLPRFRRRALNSVFAEGWALYTESLGELLGCYTDPYQRMAAYGNEIHRAIRLVVDVSLHTGKMTREEAIKYMMEHEAISEQIATSEIERYMAWPGQALSYKVGELKIKELRDKYQNQLGAKFSLRDFHDAILKGGSMPLDVFEQEMDNWARMIQ